MFAGTVSLSHPRAGNAHVSLRIPTNVQKNSWPLTPSLVMVSINLLKEKCGHRDNGTTLVLVS